MKRFITFILVITMLSCIIVTSASAGSIPTICPKCGAAVKVQRDGYDHSVEHVEVIGNAAYLIVEVRHSYSTVCVNNHGCDGYYVVNSFRELLYYIN